MLNWRGLDYPKDKFFHKGTELAYALCGAHSRFQIVETRCFTDDPQDRYGLHFCVRDAATVSDAQVREGKRPAIARTFEDLDEAIAWCQANDPFIDFDE
jgi:hypothetical protein